jgi:hypothetical protein
MDFNDQVYEQICWMGWGSFSADVLLADQPGVRTSLLGFLGSGMWKGGYHNCLRTIERDMRSIPVLDVINTEERRFEAVMVTRIPILNPSVQGS